MKEPIYRVITTNTILVFSLLALGGTIFMLVSHIIFHTPCVWKELMHAIGLALATSGAIGLAFGVFMRVQMYSKFEKDMIDIIDRESQMLATGISKICKTRHELPKFESLFENAKDILIIGIDLEITLTGQRSFIEKLIERGIKVRILVVDPDSPAMDAIAKTVQHKPSELKQDAKKNLETLKDFLEKFEDNQLTARKLDYAPTCSAIIVYDELYEPGKALNRGRTLQLELLPYRMDVLDRPNLIVKPTKGGLFETWVEALERAYNEGIDI